MRRRTKLNRSSSICNKIESDSIIPKESDICKHFVTRFKQEKVWNQFNKDLVLIHIPNENISSIGYRMHLSAMGLIAGVFDYMILYYGKVAFIEFKRDNKCKLSKHQQKFKDILDPFQIRYLITSSVDEAITFCKSL